MILQKSQTFVDGNSACFWQQLHTHDLQQPCPLCSRVETHSVLILSLSGVWNRTTEHGQTSSSGAFFLTLAPRRTQQSVLQSAGRSGLFLFTSGDFDKTKWWKLLHCGTRNLNVWHNKTGPCCYWWLLFLFWKSCRVFHAFHTYFGFRTQDDAARCYRTLILKTKHFLYIPEPLLWKEEVCVSCSEFTLKVSVQQFQNLMFCFCSSSKNTQILWEL